MKNEKDWSTVDGKTEEISIDRTYTSFDQFQTAMWEIAVVWIDIMSPWYSKFNLIGSRPAKTPNAQKRNAERDGEREMERWREKMLMRREMSTD